MAEQLRARALAHLKKHVQAVQAADAAAAIWEAVEFTPGEVEALTLGLIESAAAPVPVEAASDRYLARIRELARREALRPLATAGALAASNRTLFGLQRLRDMEYMTGLALDLYERYKPGSREMAASLWELGFITGERQDLISAEQYYKRALDLYEKIAPLSGEVESCLSNLAYVAYDRRNLEAAESYARRYLESVEQSHPDSPRLIWPLRLLGIITCERGDLAAAESFLRRALALYYASARSPDTRFRTEWQSEAWLTFGSGTTRNELNNLVAVIQARRGRPEDALNTVEQDRASALARVLRERSGLGLAPARSASYRAALQKQVQSMAAVSRAAADSRRAKRALELARNAPPGTTAERLSALEIHREASGEKLQAAWSAYTQARLATEAAYTSLRKSYPDVMTDAGPLQRVKSILPKDTLYLVFALDSREAAEPLLLLVTPGQPVQSVVLNMKAGQLRRLISRFTAAVALEARADPTASPSAIEASRALFSALFPPQAARRVLAAKRLLISPDGALWTVPFAALVTNPSGDPIYLGLEKPITYTASLAIFAQSQKVKTRLAPGGSLSALIVGNPTFNRPSAKHARPSAARSPSVLPARRLATLAPDVIDAYGQDAQTLWENDALPRPVPETAFQVEAIASLYRTAALMQADATEANLRRRVGSADVVHLASHGLFQPELTMSSGVLLTPAWATRGADGHEDDGALQAWEFLSPEMKLRAEIVVLSACELGRGQPISGEGLVGMTRALQYAGARSSLVGLWKVEVGATGDLMLAFHKGFKAGQRKDDALMNAMRQVQRQPRYSHPYFWAPFLLTGNPDNPLAAGRRTGF